VGDWIHVKAILEPLAAAGVTAGLTDAALIDEVTAGNFFVMERDGKIIGCAALRRYVSPVSGNSSDGDDGGSGGDSGSGDGGGDISSSSVVIVAEVAAFAVRPGYRNEGRGDQLLQYLESRAKSAGIQKLFLLTTRTADWFVQRGFIHAGAACDSPLLPPGKTALEGRNSQLYLRTLIE
jgi:amino-acid N-acetyltransferase